MNKQQERRIRQWCIDNNWTDLFFHENKHISLLFHPPLLIYHPSLINTFSKKKKIKERSMVTSPSLSQLGEV